MAAHDYPGDESARHHYLGQIGVWRGAGRSPLSPELAVALEQLGYGTLWVGGSPDGSLADIERLLDATTTLTLATGIVNIWQDPADVVAASWARIEARHPGRFLLGVGAGHREATREYARPYEVLSEYVSTLLGAGVPRDRLALAALGPKVLRLAAERTAGAHPYLVTPEHTRMAREVMGAGPLLAPEHKAVIGGDPARSLALARRRVQLPYLSLLNYTANLRRLGWSDSDLRDGGSDALINALVARGSAGQVAARLREHLAAGADHVCVQLLAEDDAALMAGYRELAAALGLS